MVGDLIESAQNREECNQFDSVNPANGELIGTFPLMREEQVGRVVATAREAAPWWASRTPAQRERMLLRWVAQIARHADALADLLHREHGKPASDARVLEIVPALEQIRWAAKNAGRVLRTRRVNPGMLTANYGASVEYRPLGVVGVIGPWNYPVFTPASGAGYALAAGNTVVLKPSEYTPAAAEFLIQRFEAANPNAPAGVLTLVTGDGQTGAALCRSGIDKIAFTGSPATARRVMGACAENLVPVLLECGGKDPMIVAADANVVSAAREAVWGAMSNSGQTCVGIERVFVVEAVAESFLAAVADELHGVRAGSDPNSMLGPMTMPAQQQVVRRHVMDALDRGARAIVGGPESFHGPYVDPIVLTDVPEDANAEQDETFGPTMTVTRVPDLAEAVRRANGTSYALGASVFSAGRGMEIARRLDAGMVSVNSALAFVGIPSLPFGGQGESGFGRVHGAAGLREFAQTKSYAQRTFNTPGVDLARLGRSRTASRAVQIIARLRHG